MLTLITAAAPIIVAPFESVPDRASRRGSPHRRGGKRPQRPFEARAEREQRTIGAGGRIEFERHRQAALGKTGGQHQAWYSGRTGGRDVARNGRIEGYGPAPDEKRGLLSD